MIPATIPSPTRFIGCDVGKTTIVVFDTRDGRTYPVPNQCDALAEFALALDETCLLVCEATGGYEDLLLAAALEAGCPAHRADARKVKAFIRSLGTLGKTDAIDAKALATYAQERHARLVRQQATDPQRDRLQTLVLTRRDLVAQRVANANRRDAPGAEPIRNILEDIIGRLQAAIAAIEARIDALIDAHDTLHRARDTLCAITGIGARTAAGLLALMLELGHIDRRQAASLAGLAPHPNQSGKRDGYRRTKGGRPEVRRCLFMAAMSAAKHHPILADAYKALIQNGKKKIVALTAIMRRIIVIANVKIRDIFDQQKRAFN